MAIVELAFPQIKPFEGIAEVLDPQLRALFLGPLKEEGVLNGYLGRIVRQDGETVTVYRPLGLIRRFSGNKPEANIF